MKFSIAYQPALPAGRLRAESLLLMPLSEAVLTSVVAEDTLAEYYLVVVSNMPPTNALDRLSVDNDAYVYYYNHSNMIAPDRSPEYHNHRDRNTRVEKLANHLEALGLSFDTIPQDIYPGMRYITPSELIVAGLTTYSDRSIARFVRLGIISAHRIGRQILLGAEGVHQLLERERASLAGELREDGLGSRPGDPRSCKPRNRRRAAVIS